MSVFLKAISVLSASTDLSPSPPLILCNLSTDLTSLLKLYSQRSPIGSWKSDLVALPHSHHVHFSVAFGPTSIGKFLSPWASWLWITLFLPWLPFFLQHLSCLQGFILTLLFSAIQFHTFSTWMILKLYAQDLKYLPPLWLLSLGFCLTFLKAFHLLPNV